MWSDKSAVHEELIKYEQKEELYTKIYNGDYLIYSLHTNFQIPLADL